MKKGPNFVLIYFLIFIIFILLIVLTKVVLDSSPKKEEENTGYIEKLEIKQYPDVNDECIFNVTLNEYSALTMAGCKNGYTRYNITDIVLDDNSVPVSIIYSDKKQKKVGVFVKDKRVTNKLDDIKNVVFGIFDNNLFIFDKSGKESNIFAFNSLGKEIYNLKNVLSKNKIKDLATGDTYIDVSKLDPNSFIFTNGSIEFNSIANECKEGVKASGSKYKVTYSKEKFNKPEFQSLVNCS